MAESQEQFEVVDLSDEAKREAVLAIANSLEKEADDRVNKRYPVERRWLDDLAQFHGKYDERIAKDLKDDKKSNLFINATRPKTNVMESRLSDMLFPTDDRNWGIFPTPVPELVTEAENRARFAADTMLAAAAAPEDDDKQRAAFIAEEHLAVMQSEMDEAKKRSRAMEEEIDDHFRECRYSIQARDVIRDACKLGTGIMKGPVTDGKYKSTWERLKTKAGEAVSNVFQLNYDQDSRPAFWRVDPWNFFPDSDSTSMEENEAVFERHMLNKKQLRRLSREPGFNRDAIRTLLLEKPRNTTPSYLADLRSITASYNDMIRDRYHVWEYHGPLKAQEMKLLAEAMGDEDAAAGLDEDIDPLEELLVVVWFCQGEIMKLGIHHLDSGDSIYSVFNLEKDEASIFGFGIPHIMRDPQAALAGAWRILMDNMGLSAGPQIVINEDVIEPVNGVWKLEPRKLWRRKGAAPPDKKPFEIFDIPSHMADLLAVIEVSKKNVDEETALPMLAQGEQGTQVTKTAQGMSILMNSVNVVFRRIIKNFDDDMTTQNVSRMYDWLMQFSDKEHIKGDYQVDARGSSVLLVREMQSANMMAFLTNFGNHPVLAKYLREEGLPALRKLAKAMLIPADEVIKSTAEIKADAAKAAKEPPAPNPEMEKIAATMNVEKLKGETAIELAMIGRETQLIKLAAEQNWSQEELKAMMESKQAERDSKERVIAVEAAMAIKTGEGGGGSI